MIGRRKAREGLWFLEKKRGQVVVRCHKLQYEIPDAYFDGDEGSISTDLHGKVETLGFLNLLVFVAEDDTSPQAYSFKVPAEILLHYSSKGKFKTKSGDVIRTFTCNENELFMDNVKVVQSASSFYKIFKCLTVARLTNVSYEELANTLLQGAKINGINPGVNRTLFEAFIGEMARSPLDEYVPFRVHYGQGKIKKNEFRFMRIKDIPRVSSPFTSLNFEDSTVAIQRAVQQSVSKKPQKISPIEKVMKY